MRTVNYSALLRGPQPRAGGARAQAWDTVRLPGILTVPALQQLIPSTSSPLGLHSQTGPLLTQLPISTISQRQNNTDLYSTHRADLERACKRTTHPPSFGFIVHSQPSLGSDTGGAG